MLYITKHVNNIEKMLGMIMFIISVYAMFIT